MESTPTYAEWMREADFRIERGFSITLATWGGATMCAEWQAPHKSWLMKEYVGSEEDGIWLAGDRELREEIAARLRSGKWVLFTD